MADSAIEPSAPSTSPDAHAKRRARADRISGVILAVLMAGAFAVVVRTIVHVASGPLPTGPGNVAPAFATRTPTGSPIALGDHAGQVVLVDFWATWCPPCVASMPTLERVYRAYANQGFTVVGVNQEAGEEQHVQGFLREQGLTFPIAMDDGRIASQFGVFTFPTSFLVGKDGVVRHVHRGVASEAGLRGEIEALLREPAAKPGAARAAGEVGAAK